jgi:hypothetical protein
MSRSVQEASPGRFISERSTFRSPLRPSRRPLPGTATCTRHPFGRYGSGCPPEALPDPRTLSESSS